MTQIVLAPCSPFSVTMSLLRDSAALARQYKVKLHTHLCETRDEERYTLERFHLRPVDWMETHGWLGDDVWFAHAIHVDDDEIKNFAQTGCGAAHCPCSNMRLGSGIAPIKKYLAAGVKVGLGVDGSASNDASNMLLEVRQAMLLARLQMGLLPPEGPRKYFLLSQSDPVRANEWMTAREALELATLGGARVLGRSDIGSLEPGKCADFFSLDLHTIGYAGALHDPVAATLFCAPQSAKFTVIQRQGHRARQAKSSPMDMKPVIETHNCCASRNGESLRDLDAFNYGPEHHHRSSAARRCGRREKMGKRVRLAGGRDLVILGAAGYDAHAHRPGVIPMAGADRLAGRAGDRRDLQGRRTRPVHRRRPNGKQRRFSRNAAGRFLLLSRSGTKRPWAETSSCPCRPDR